MNSKCKQKSDGTLNESTPSVYQLLPLVVPPPPPSVYPLLLVVVPPPRPSVYPLLQSIFIKNPFLMMFHHCFHCNAQNPTPGCFNCPNTRPKKINIP